MVVEAPPGSATEAYLDAWASRIASAGNKVWRLPCSFETGGAWAGIKQLLDDLVAGATSESADLMALHSAELSLVLPLLRPRLAAHHRTLTDTAPSGEKVRNYPRDRAYRIVHGLIEFVASLVGRETRKRVVFLCNGFSDAGELTRLFFLELLRRRGLALRMLLVVVNQPGTTDRAALARAATAPRFFRPAIPRYDRAVAEPRADLTGRAWELEGAAASDPLLREEHLADLVHCWTHSETPEAAWIWRAYSFTYCHHYGLYDAALRYASTVLEHLSFILRARPSSAAGTSWGRSVTTTLRPVSLSWRSRSWNEKGSPRSKTQRIASRCSTPWR